MLSSIAKGLAAQGRRSMSTVRYTEFGHPLTVLKCVATAQSRPRSSP
jgi:hypothetical protein